MIRAFFLSGLLSAATLLAAPSSIDTPGLPEPPPARFGVETVKRVDRDAEVWFLSYEAYEKNGEPIKHGLWIERTRSRDRERYDTDYVEERRIYYDGEKSTHAVTSVWEGGVLRSREYRLSDELDITLDFNPDGQVMRGPKANARGGRAKRERITAIFDDIYKLNNP